MRCPLKTFFCLTGVVAWLVGCNPPRAEAPPRDLDHILADFRNPASRTLVAAHRGDWRNAPENSLPAIRYCIDRGIDIVEIDLRKTKDGHLVLMHDETLDRTTDGVGKVSDWTLDSLKRLHLRNGLGRPTRESIPTLKEAMEAIKGKIMVNLDKGYDYFPGVMAILEETGTTRQAIMKGHVPAEQVMQEYGAYLDKIVFMPVIVLDDPLAAQWVSGYEQKLKPVAYEFIFRQDTSRVIKDFPALGKRGARVWVNSLWPALCAGHDDDAALEDPDPTWGWLLDKGATILQTDRPEELSRYVHAREWKDVAWETN